MAIHDPEVDDPAEDARQPAEAASQSDSLPREPQPDPRLARAKALADAMGPGASDFDMKADTDEMWGET